MREIGMKKGRRHTSPNNLLVFIVPAPSTVENQTKSGCVGCGALIVLSSSCALRDSRAVAEATVKHRLVWLIWPHL